jgi:hypothetical protein
MTKHIEVDYHFVCERVVQKLADGSDDGKMTCEEI